MPTALVLVSVLLFLICALLPPYGDKPDWLTRLGYLGLAALSLSFVWGKF